MLCLLTCDIIDTRPAQCYSFRCGILESIVTIQACRTDISVVRQVIVVNIVTDRSAEACGEVKVLVDELRGQTHGDRSCRALVAVAVSLRDDAVTVTVDEDTLKRFTILVINLLVDEEGVHRLTHLLHLDTDTVTTRDSVAGPSVVVLAATGELGYLIVVPAYIVADIPCKVLGDDGLGIDRELNTVVLQRTHILPKLRSEVGTGRNNHALQQVFGLTVVTINTGSDAVVEESEVETGVIGCGLLPCQIRVVRLRTQGADKSLIVVALTELVHSVLITDDVEGHVVEVGDVTTCLLLTSDTVRETKLEVVPPGHVLEELLGRDAPHESG